MLVLSCCPACVEPAAVIHPCSAGAAFVRLVARWHLVSPAPVPHGVGVAFPDQGDVGVMLREVGLAQVHRPGLAPWMGCLRGVVGAVPSHRALGTAKPAGKGCGGHGGPRLGFPVDG